MLNHSRIRRLFKFFLRLFTQVEVRGMENVPISGAFILAPNHLGSLDVPLLGAHIQRNDASFLAAKKHRRSPINRWIFDSTGGIWIDRNQADLGALRAARNALKDGQILGVAPEGTRSSTHSLIEGKAGAAYLASLSQVPVLPAAITGTENAVGQILRLRRPHLTLTFGKPFIIPPLDRRDREASLKRGTDEIMCRIAALLPPDYRGVYADHPRLLELLAQAQPLQTP